MKVVFTESASHSTLAIFPKTRDREKWLPDKTLIYEGIGCEAKRLPVSTRKKEDLDESAPSTP